MPVQRHRHQREKVASLDAEAVCPNSNGDAKEESRRLKKTAQTSGGTSVEDSTEEHKQAKNLWSLRKEFMTESSNTSSAMTTRAKVDDDRLVNNGQMLTTS